MQTPTSILVIDDDEDIREIMTMALVNMGYTVETAADGIAASRLLLGGFQPALVLLDLMMPGMDGEAFLAAMRRDPSTADIPVAIISGNRTARQKATELGAQGCLIKPFDLDELARVVEQTLASK